MSECSACRDERPIDPDYSCKPRVHHWTQLGVEFWQRCTRVALDPMTEAERDELEYKLDTETQMLAEET